MKQVEKKFEDVLTYLHGIDKEVLPGVMFHCSTITYRKKVVCFLFQDAVAFKVGKDADVEKLGIADAPYLNPFKKKPPMTGWRVVKDTKKWKKLGKYCLEKMK